MFNKVDPKPDFPALERELLLKWEKDNLLQKYLEKNNNSRSQFSFLDGPITANNPMGVHHAWGRAYKDLWQRFHNMLGDKQRFQNGFDEQGLWVEVEVEKELGLNSKKEIENIVPGDPEASIAKFINLCKERVKKYSGIQTEQSKRLGYFMDWENSYHTSSNENNYQIWNFLKKVYDDGNLYKGHDTVPWCPRCGTAISQHEILTEEYKELTHESVYFKLPIKDKENEFLLVWTTTPWTIPANVAVAVNSKENYVQLEVESGLLWVMEKRLENLRSKKVISPEAQVKQTKSGKELIGWEYMGPFDNLPLVEKILNGYIHRVIDGGEVVTTEEGTGLLHVAPGAGEEDFKLAKEQGLPVIAAIEEDASYLQSMGAFAGLNAKQKPGVVVNFLKENENGKYFWMTQSIVHRYPTCWRCKSELVWRVVDEWYIAMDRKSDLEPELGTYRERMIAVAKKVTWIPSWGKDREIDWLNNMHDWLISKKRYWGLALPIFECKKCGHFEVAGSEKELQEKAVEGWDVFKGNSPHRPWVDNIKIKCSKCGEIVSRIPDVGNPWLDAGIVPFSTLPEGWFPADLVGESFPGQFKNWFYSMIAMSAVLKNTNPMKTVFGYASMRDEKGEEMHKSKGNAIWFDDGAEKIGVDVMRWLYMTQNPELNLNFGYQVTDQVRRQFFLILWNVYKFFVDYALVDDWVAPTEITEPKSKNFLDQWIISRLNQLIETMTINFKKYDVMTATRSAEDFVNDLSTWYLRRSRDRVGAAAEGKEDKTEFYLTLHFILTTLCKVLSPVVPFITEIIYTNLTGERSVHLTSWPESGPINQKLIGQMVTARQVVEKGHSLRKENNIKVRQPLSSLKYSATERLPLEIETVVLLELNVKEIQFKISDSLGIELDLNLTAELKQEGEAREIIRSIQEQRKLLGVSYSDYIDVELPSWPQAFEDYIKKETLIRQLGTGETLKVNKSESQT